MPEIHKLDEILDLLWSGHRLEGSLDCVKLGRCFQVCINGSATEHLVSPSAALDLLGRADIRLIETKEMLILEIIPIST